MAEFADRAVLHIKAGNGGHGCASVHREKFKPLGGPDGGNGGRGGDVILEVHPSVATLLDFHRRPVRKAGNGTQGSGSNRNGAAGDDLVVRVPNGTVVSTEDGEVLADLMGTGTRFVAAQGGHGGLGNAALASMKRKAPGFALRGEPGAEILPGPRAQDGGRRGPGGLPQRGQVLADRRAVRGQAQGRRLPVHHADPAPGRGRSGRHPVRGGGRARPDPRGQPGQGPGPGLPPARGALPGAGARAGLHGRGDQRGPQPEPGRRLRRDRGRTRRLPERHRLGPAGPAPDRGAEQDRRARRAGGGRAGSSRCWPLAG